MNKLIANLLFVLVVLLTGCTESTKEAEAMHAHAKEGVISYAFSRLTEKEKARVDSITKTKEFIEYQKTAQDLLKKVYLYLNTLPDEEYRKYTKGEHIDWDGLKKDANLKKDFTASVTSFSQYRQLIKPLNLSSVESSALFIIAFYEGYDGPSLDVR